MQYTHVSSSCSLRNMAASRDPVARCSCCQPHRIYTDYWATAACPVALAAPFRANMAVQLPHYSQDRKWGGGKTMSCWGRNKETLQTSRFPGCQLCWPPLTRLRWGCDCLIIGTHSDTALIQNLLQKVNNFEAGHCWKKGRITNNTADRINLFTCTFTHKHF